jgi:hypothetical protein
MLQNLVWETTDAWPINRTDWGTRKGNAIKASLIRGRGSVWMNYGGVFGLQPK